METWISCLTIIHAFCINLIATDFSTYMDKPNCPSDVKTNDEVIIKLELKSSKTNWTNKQMIGIKRNNAFIFKYIPQTKNAPFQNPRIVFKTESANRKFNLVINFNDDLDSGETFILCYSDDKDSAKCDDFCSFQVKDSNKTYLVLSRTSPPNMGMRIRGFYVENETITIECNMICYPKNLTFSVIFPKSSDFKVITDESDKKVYNLKLTRNIKQKSIICKASDGTSVERSDFLYFTNIKKVKIPKNKTKLAISLAVLFGLTVCIMLPVGAYTLIIKQRKINTKEMIDHHAQEAQTRLQSQMNTMSRMSRMSRMSKMEPTQ